MCPQQQYKSLLHISAMSLGADNAPLHRNTNIYRNVTTLVGRNISLDCPIQERENNKVKWDIILLPMVKQCIII